MTSSPWTATQLDRIEDALEDLERDGVPAEYAAGPDAEIVGTPLSAYRQILLLSREAMPMQDVPAGLLDAVLAEAHASVAESPATLAPNLGQNLGPVGAAAAAEPSQGWWPRARASVWLPALGFAAAAAALLLFIGPGAEQTRDAHPVAQRVEGSVAQDAPEKTKAAPAAPEEGTDRATRLADAHREGESALPWAPDGQRGAGALGGVVGEQTPPSQAQADEDGAPSQPEPKPETKRNDAAPARAPKPSPAKGSETRVKADKKRDSAADPADQGNGSRGAGPVPGEAPTHDADRPSPPPAEPANNALDPKLAKLLERGERRRMSGKCGLAQLDFQQVRKSAAASMRARALAGLGLCELAAGNDDAAESFFGQARRDDADVDGFIERERAKLAAAKQRSPNKTKK